MINKVKNPILQNNNELINIYTSGFFDPDEKDFIIDTKFIYLLIGNKKLKISTLVDRLVLQINIVDNFDYPEIDDEDFISGVIKITELILNNPDKDLIIKSIIFYNLNNLDDHMITDALTIELYDEEVIFINPFYFQTLVGNGSLKGAWENDTDFFDEKVKYKMEFI